MTEPQAYDLQIMIASGPEDLARAVLGFAFAVSATVSGAKVLVILTLHGTAWQAQDEPAARQKANGFDSIESYLAALKEAGAAIRMCSACVTTACVTAGASDPEAWEERPYIGLTEAAIRAADRSVQTVVF